MQRQIMVEADWDHIQPILWQKNYTKEDGMAGNDNKIKFLIEGYLNYILNWLLIAETLNTNKFFSDGILKSEKCECIYLWD